MCVAHREKGKEYLEKEEIGILYKKDGSSRGRSERDSGRESDEREA